MRSSAALACAPLSRRATAPSALSRRVTAAAPHRRDSWLVRPCCTPPLLVQRPRPVTKGASSDSPLEGKKHRRPPPSVSLPDKPRSMRDVTAFTSRLPHTRSAQRLHARTPRLANALFQNGHV